MQKEKTKGAGITTWVFMIAIISLVAAWMTPDNREEKKYKIEVTLNEANAILYVVDKSTAEHTTVAAIQKLITEQVNAQIKTDDSLLKLKEKPKTDTSKKKN